MTRKLVTALVAVSMALAVDAAAAVPGRIAISSDGNKHDCDDLLATAVSIAILAKTGNAGKLRYYGHSDHIWATSGGCDGGNREEEMHKSSYGTAQKWGGFDLSVFYNAKQDTTAAVNKLVALINASSSSDPLWIIGAGPMEVIGRAIQKSDSTKRQYVTLISHSEWNNNHADEPTSNENPQHSGWTFAEIGNLKPTVKLVKIKDQNSGLHTSFSTYNSWRDSSDPKLRWLWDRAQLINKTWFDCSDAGMVYWLVHGRGSDQTLTPTELLDLFASTGTPPPDDTEPPPDDTDPPPDDTDPPPDDAEAPPPPTLLKVVPVPGS